MAKTPPASRARIEAIREKPNAINGDMAELARNIELARIEAGMSQYDLAARSDISQPHISKIEAGSWGPKLNTLLVLARALDVDPGSLLPGAHQLPVKPTKDKAAELYRVADLLDSKALKANGLDADGLTFLDAVTRRPIDPPLVRTGGPVPSAEEIGPVWIKDFGQRLLAAPRNRNVAVRDGRSPGDAAVALEQARVGKD